MTSIEQLLERASKFRPVERVWAAAACVDREDVRQQIFLALLEDENPARAVPCALKIRRLGTRWRSSDPAVCASLADAQVVDLAAAEAAEIEVGDVDASGLLACASGGTAEIATRCQIGRRAAQLRVAKQIERFGWCGDLFAAGREVHDGA